MDSKQAQIEKLVVQYFGQRTDTDVSPASEGIYRVLLQSEVAQTDFGGRRQLNLIFDSELAYENPQSELITANHPFLDIIRNDLERHQHANPHLTEAHLRAQVMNPEGHIAVPQLVFSRDIHNVDYQIGYSPIFILSYRIVYETDERTESIVHLCYNAVTGSPQPELIPRLSKILPLEGKPPQAGSNSNLDLARVLAAGRDEIETRVRANIQIMGQQISALLESEKHRLQEHYQSELTHIPARDIVTREQLKETLEKDIVDLERKLSCQAHVQLLSVFRLWWPVVDYKVMFLGSQTTFTVSGIRYNSQSEQTTLFRCETCGNQTRYDVCVVEKHVFCGGRCSKGVTQCAICGEVYCAEHGVACSHCSAPVCQHDYRSCDYGKHSLRDNYCPNCLVQSFEGRLLCRDCLEQCDVCHRNFPHERIVVCRIGGEHICADHDRSPDALVCEDCKSVTCLRHGLYTSDGKWACTDHVKETTCCKRTFIRSTVLQCCVDSQELLCSEHHVACFECGQAVCERHSSRLAKHRGQFVCVNCRHTCARCANKQLDYSYVKRDLTACGTCEQPVCVDHRQVCAVCNSVVCTTHQQLSVEGQVLCPLHAQVATCCNRTFVRSQLILCSANQNEVLCPEHRYTCVIGREVVCRNHVRVSVDREALCQIHAGVCIQCNPEKLYRSDRLSVCGTCEQPVCVDHRQVCAVCNSVVCTTHQQLSVEGQVLCPLHAQVATCCNRTFVRSQLILCSANQNEVLCPEHRYTCVIGREVVCRNHVRMSVDREVLCQIHAGVCIQCNPGKLHRSDRLRVCVTCLSHVCETDSSICQICQSYYTCNAHRQTQPACASCGRTSCGDRGCLTDGYRCQSCGMNYCRHCISRSGRCLTCEGLKQMPPNDDRLRSLQHACNTLDDDTAQILRPMLDAPSRLALYSASNRTYRVLIVHYTPPWYQVWKTPQRMRLVITRTGQVVNVIQERADS